MPQVVVAISAVFSLVMNALAITLPLGGRSTDEIARAYPTLVEPAGYVFSIWSVIYVLLIGYVVWQALPSQRRPGSPALAVAPFVVAVNVLNGLWLLAWHELWLGTSVLVMLALLASLIAVYNGLRAGDPGDAAVPRAEMIWARGTFSVYLAWITVAAVANISVYLVSVGWDGGFVSPRIWAVLMLAVATAVGVLAVRRHRDLAFAAVLVWALIGIVVARPSVHVVAAAAVLGVLTLLYAAAVGSSRAGYTATR